MDPPGSIKVNTL